MSERNWQTVLRMAREWLASALFPTSFCWYALKRSVKVSNYVLITVDNQLTAPFEMVYQQQPGLHNLFQCLVLDMSLK